MAATVAVVVHASFRHVSAGVKEEEARMKDERMRDEG
jgi:hypothetical protein